MDKGEDVFVEEEEIDNGMPQIQSKTPNKCVHTVSEAQQKSAPTTPEMKHKTSLAPVQKVRHHSVANKSPIERFPTKMRHLNSESTTCSARRCLRMLKQQIFRYEK